MLDSIEDRVYALVAEERGVRREKLASSTSLSNDLGLEGDDAVEFFEDFSREFAVDLTALGADWQCYFGKEGVGLGGILLVVVPTVVLASVLRLSIPSLPFWLCPVIGLVAWIVAVYYWQKKHPDRRPQIHIQDLVDCAKAGTWTKKLSPDVRARGTIRWFTS